jgi:hypothetical protein
VRSLRFLAIRTCLPTLPPSGFAHALAGSARAPAQRAGLEGKVQVPKPPKEEEAWWEDLGALPGWFPLRSWRLIPTAGDCRPQFSVLLKALQQVVDVLASLGAWLGR